MVKVYELIDILKTMDQDALVNIYNGYDSEYGECFKNHGISVTQQSVGWDDYNDRVIIEVFIE